MRVKSLEPEFVEFVPSGLDSGVLYVSMAYATASHLCACGCGTRVVTPLGPVDWTLTFDGRVTLSPSIGNGQQKCRSHYLVRDNQVVWCRPMSQKAALAVHEADVERRDAASQPAPRVRWWTKFVRWVRQLR